MNRLDILIKVYAQLHNYSGVPYWMITPLRKMIRSVANKMLPKYLKKNKSNGKKSDSHIVVSFTSFPARINSVWQVVECIKRQTYQPAKILLWLSKEQFSTEESIPLSLRKLENDVFEIHLVEGDIRSHKKYLYAFRNYPNDYLLLIDDDIYYPSDFIERTWKAHKESPNSVICNYGYKILYDGDGHLLPYKKWPRIYKQTSDNIFFGSGGGTLLKLSMLHPDVDNIDIAQALTPIADDIWLNAMVNLEGTKKVLLNNGQILPICIKNNTKLATQNRGNNRNDEQLNAVIDYYKKKMGKDPFNQLLN